MKNILTALILGVVLAGISSAQGSAKVAIGKTGKVRMAVVEFTPTSNAATMTAEAKRHLQASIAFSLYETKKLDVVDVRNTRSASQNDLATINSGDSTVSAVRVGKLLGVNYILTGIVTEYTPKGPDGYGQGEIKVRLVEVATGKVRYSGTISARSGKPMRSSGAAEMQSQVLKHVIDQLAVLIAEKV